MPHGVDPSIEAREVLALGGRAARPVRPGGSLREDDTYTCCPTVNAETDPSEAAMRCWRKIGWPGP